MIDYKKLLPAGITVEKVFADVLPAVHDEQRDEYADYVEGMDIVIAVRLTDARKLWTVRFNADEIEIEDDELVDFPIVTIEGTQKQWPNLLPYLVEILTTLESRRKELKPKKRFDATLQAALERFDGVIDLCVTGDDPTDNLRFRLILNNYAEHTSFRRFSITIPRSVVFDVVEGRTPIESAARGLSVQGDVGLAVDLGGTILEHFQP